MRAKKPVYRSECVYFKKLEFRTSLLSRLYPIPFLSANTASTTAFIWTLCVRVVFDRHMFLMLCGCYVDILRGLACISHLCRSGCFVCFNYYGRPPVVILHFGGAFKMPLLVCYAPSHSKDSGPIYTPALSALRRFQRALHVTREPVAEPLHRTKYFSSFCQSIKGKRRQ